MARRLLILTLSAGLAAAAGCARHGEAGAAGPDHPPAQVLRFGNGTEPQDLDPQAVTGIPELNIIDSLFEGLVTGDPHDLHPIPGLAKSWDVSPDGLVYTFHLRDGIRWSDGAPITVDDFVQSYKRILTPQLGSEYSYLLWFVWEPPTTMRAGLRIFPRLDSRPWTTGPSG